MPNSVTIRRAISLERSMSLLAPVADLAEDHLLGDAAAHEGR